MAKRLSRTKGEKIAQRAIHLARQVTDRVFVSPNGPYLVSGAPEFRQLRQCLEELSELPPADAIPSPLDLGFGPDQITPLTGENLSAWGRGLQKWRKITAEYEKPRKKTAERREKYNRWKVEIDQISSDLEGLWHVFHQWEVGTPIAGAPYIRISASRPDSVSPFDESLWNWFMVLVDWLAGESAGNRFRRSLESLMKGFGLAEKHRHFARVLSRLTVIQDQYEEISSYKQFPMP